MKGNSVNLSAMVSGEATVDGVPHSAELLRFVDAVLANPDVSNDGNNRSGHDENGKNASSKNASSTVPANEELANARTALRRVLTDAAFVDACATVASFNAVVKVADGTGIPLEPLKAEKTAQLRAELAIDQLRDHGRFDQ